MGIEAADGVGVIMFSFPTLKCDKIKIDDIKDLDLTVGQLEALIPLVEE